MAAYTDIVSLSNSPNANVQVAVPSNTATKYRGKKATRCLHGTKAIRKAQAHTSYRHNSRTLVVGGIVPNIENRVQGWPVKRNINTPTKVCYIARKIDRRGRPVPICRGGGNGSNQNQPIASPTGPPRQTQTNSRPAPVTPSQTPTANIGPPRNPGNRPYHCVPRNPNARQTTYPTPLFHPKHLIVDPNTPTLQLFKMPPQRLQLICLSRFTPLNISLLGEATFLTVHTELPGPKRTLAAVPFTKLIHRAVTRLPLVSPPTKLLSVRKCFLLRETGIPQTLLIPAPPSYGDPPDVTSASITCDRRCVTAPNARAG